MMTSSVYHLSISSISVWHDVVYVTDDDFLSPPSGWSKLCFSVFQLIINIRWAFFLEIFDSFTYYFFRFVRIFLDFTYLSRFYLFSPPILFFRFSSFNILSIVFTWWLLILNWEVMYQWFFIFSGSYPIFGKYFLRINGCFWNCSYYFINFLHLAGFHITFWFQSYALISFLTFDFRISSHFH